MYIKQINIHGLTTEEISLVFRYQQGLVLLTPYLSKYKMRVLPYLPCGEWEVIL